jgi:hypothetical protein
MNKLIESFTLTNVFHSLNGSVARGKKETKKKKNTKKRTRSASALWFIPIIKGQFYAPANTNDTALTRILKRLNHFVLKRHEVLHRHL